MAGNSRDSGRSTLDRTFTLLDAFTLAKPSLRLTDLAELSGLPRSTCHRIVSELVELGVLEHTDDGRYAVGLRLWSLASSSPRHQELRRVAAPFMADLYEATRENVQLAVPDGLVARVVEKVSGPGSVRNVTAPGGPLSLHCTGVGKVILAFSDPSLLAQVLDAGLERHTAYTLIEPGRLTANLTQVRHTSLGWSIEERTLGACSVAAPLFGARGELTGALGIVARSSSNLERVSSAVRMAALSVSRLLASPSVPPNQKQHGRMSR
ncbi:MULTISPECIES: IclR family transcriptional regulator [unclassified Streptomyces]|uniref:IclR family transcriptional regulator n=1 Tax=unclassified Streptomyces TaxID=2593676 RepID=UPI00110FBBE8|nr:IclR family transcriptional regulator [Streptomyces sp. DASNCL29]TMU98288.1 IclR family transcriptional regulator [Streptomyces sp. DASNCL29]